MSNKKLIRFAYIELKAGLSRRRWAFLVSIIITVLCVSAVHNYNPLYGYIGIVLTVILYLGLFSLVVIYGLVNRLLSRIDNIQNASLSAASASASKYKDFLKNFELVIEIPLNKLREELAETKSNLDVTESRIAETISRVSAMESRIAEKDSKSK